MKQEMIHESKEAEGAKIPKKPVETVDVYKGLYQEVYALQIF